MNLTNVFEHINQSNLHAQIKKVRVTGFEFLAVARNIQYIASIDMYSYPESYFMVYIENTLGFVEAEGPGIISVGNSVEDILSCIQFFYKIEDTLNKRFDFNRILMKIKELGYVVLLKHKQINIYKHGEIRITELDKWIRANWKSTKKEEIIELNWDDLAWKLKYVNEEVTVECTSLYQVQDSLNKHAKMRS